MSQDPTGFSSVLFSSDAALKNALNYLFTVILKSDFEVFPDFSDDSQSAALSGAAAALFVHPDPDDTDALALIKRAKTAAIAPVVIVLKDPESGIGAQAFLAGADDVVIWPCSLHELALRLFVRLGQPAGNCAALAANATWDTEAYIAARAGLTTAEAQVMRVLFNQDGQIVSRDDLSFAVDARPWRYGDRKFDVHVAKIRKKLMDSFGSQMSVSTIRSSGYCLSTDGADLFGQG
ncbi:MAG: DNA-binding response OmpR family regulator [Sulfitobacter sp.]|jgi:two-component system, OmpR family, response regulator